MKTLIKIVVVSILGFAISYQAAKPLFAPQFFHLHDFTHVARLGEMDLSLKDGHFPVRWSKNFGFGYGMPLFNFYGPTPFYLAEGFHLLGFSYMASIEIIFYLSFLIGFIAMFYFAKRYFGIWGALVSSTAFMYAPYRAVDTFVRGSINELYGITFLTLSFLAFSEYQATKAKKWISLGAFFLAGIITSHNISALFAFPALAVFGLVLAFGSPVKERARSIKGLLAMFVLSILLSASYALPAYTEKNLVNLDTITSGYFHYSQHFLYLRQFLNSPFGYGGSIYGLEDGLSFEIGKIHLLLATIAIGLLILRWKKVEKQTRVIVVSVAIMMVIAMLMATFKTEFLWDKIKLLQFIQFPWRFLSLIIILVSFLSGAVVQFAASMKLPKHIVSITSVIALILFNQSIFKPEGYLEQSSDLYYADQDKIQRYVSSILPDYNPKGVPSTIEPPQNRFEAFDANGPISLTPTINRTQEFLVEVPLKQKTHFTANIFAFKGWQLYVNDQKVEAQINDPLPTQSLDLDPLALHTDRVYISGILESTPIQWWGNMLSVLGIMILVYIGKKA